MIIKIYVLDDGQKSCTATIQAAVDGDYSAV